MLQNDQKGSREGLLDLIKAQNCIIGESLDHPANGQGFLHQCWLQDPGPPPEERIVFSFARLPN